MRTFNLAVALTLSASVADAQQDGLAQLVLHSETGELVDRQDNLDNQKGGLVNHSEEIWEEDDEDHDDEKITDESSEEDDGDTLTIGRQLKRSKRGR